MESKVQEPLVPTAMNEQVTGFPTLGVAVSVTTVPDSREETLNVGVSSAVLLSDVLDPKSEPESRSGAAGAAGLIEIVLVDAAERLPAASTV